jgi:alcohol dehydrogenase (cytochrome c)
MGATSTDDKPSLKSLYAVAMKGRIADGTDKVGTVQAISAETGAIISKYEQRSGMLSLVATAGGLVFGGDAGGRFRAFDQKNGKVLWETNLGAPVTGFQ